MILIYAAIFVFMLILIIPIAYFLNIYFDELASWVQAVGIILSISSGLLIILLEINRQRRKLDERAQIVYMLTFLAADSVNDRLCNANNKKKRRELQNARTAEAIKAIQNIDIVYIPKEFLKSFSPIRNNLIAINEGIDKSWDNGDLTSSKRVQRKTEELWGEFNAAAEKFGIDKLPFPKAEKHE